MGHWAADNKYVHNHLKKVGTTNKELIPVMELAYNTSRFYEKIKRLKILNKLSECGLIKVDQFWFVEKSKVEEFKKEFECVLK